jgi:hypothetical protein
MHVSAFARSVLFLLAVSTLGYAQSVGQFQTPTDEELKMIADPKAPGAAAVYLDFEEVNHCSTCSQEQVEVR